MQRLAGTPACLAHAAIPIIGVVTTAGESATDMKNWTISSMLTLALSLAANAAVAQGLPDLQRQAEDALTDGQADQTIALAQNILVNDPDSYAALFLMALAQSELGQFRQAAISAGQAFGATRSPDEKVQAARLAASTRFRMQQFTRAEWWLRRAANNARTDEEFSNIRREFQNIRQNNPLSVWVNFSAAPSDNINNGSEDEFFQLEGLPFLFSLPPDQRALSGIEYAGDVQLSYRLIDGPRQRTSIGAYAYGRTFSLSKDTQDKVPDLKGSDFALALIDLSVTHERLIFDQVGPSSVALNVGTSRYSGKPLWDYWKVTLRQGFGLGDYGTFSLLASFQDQTARLDSQRDTEIIELTGRYAKSLANGDQLQLSLTGRLNDTSDVETTYEEYQASIDYNIDQPVFGADWAFNGGVGHVNYDEFTLSLDGRRDNYVSLGGTVTFSEISYFGFSPSLSITAKRTESDVSQFTSSQVQGRLGIQSNF